MNPEGRHGKFMGIPPEHARAGLVCEYGRPGRRPCGKKAVAVCTKHDYHDNDAWCGYALCKRHYPEAGK